MKKKKNPKTKHSKFIISGFTICLNYIHSSLFSSLHMTIWGASGLYIPISGIRTKGDCTLISYHFSEFLINFSPILKNAPLCIPVTVNPALTKGIKQY